MHSSKGSIKASKEEDARQHCWWWFDVRSFQDRAVVRIKAQGRNVFCALFDARVEMSFAIHADAGPVGTRSWKRNVGLCGNDRYLETG